MYFMIYRKRKKKYLAEIVKQAELVAGRVEETHMDFSFVSN